MNSQELMNAAKQIGTFVFAYLTARGILTHDQSTVILGDLTVVVPALCSLGTIGWSIYAHWNMKKVPESAVVVGPGLKAGGAIGAIALFALAMLNGGAHAADLAVKARPLAQISNVYPVKGCGAFYGLNAEGSSGIVNGAPAGTVAIGGDVGALIGYACPTAGIPWFVEADFDFQNLNAGNAGFSLTGPAHFTQVAGVQTPLLSWFGAFINVGQNNIPSIVPLLPPGVSVNGPPQNYVAFTSTEDDVSASFGAMHARDWIWSPGARTGLLFNLTGPGGTQAVGDTYAGVQFQSNALCLGSFACPKLGPRFVAGFSLKM